MSQFYIKLTWAEGVVPKGIPQWYLGNHKSHLWVRVQKNVLEYEYEYSNSSCSRVIFHEYEYEYRKICSSTSMSTSTLVVVEYFFTSMSTSTEKCTRVRVWVRVWVHQLYIVVVEYFFTSTSTQNVLEYKYEYFNSSCSRVLFHEYEYEYRKMYSSTPTKYIAFYITMHVNLAHVFLWLSLFRLQQRKMSLALQTRHSESGFNVVKYVHVVRFFFLNNDSFHLSF